jgi:hypothetical protein
MGSKRVVVDGVQRLLEITDSGDPEDYHTPIVCVLSCSFVLLLL